MLVAFHPADGAGNASAVNIVAKRVFLPCRGKAGFYISRLNGAYADFKWPNLVCQRHCVGIYGGLCGAVIGLKGNGYRCGNAAYIYDFAAALFAHNRNYQPVNTNHTEKIGIKKAFCIFRIRKFHRAGNSEAGVVYHKVNVPFGTDNLFNCRGNAAFIGYVRSNMVYSLRTGQAAA